MSGSGLGGSGILGGTTSGLDPGSGSGSGFGSGPGCGDGNGIFMHFPQFDLS